MSEAKIMTPLFYDYNFNRQGKKIRAVVDRVVSNGAEVYSLWRRSGRPDYPEAVFDDDMYALSVELNGYLVPIFHTYHSLVRACGEKPAVAVKQKGRCSLIPLGRTAPTKAISWNTAIRRNVRSRRLDQILQGKQTTLNRSSLSGATPTYRRSWPEVPSSRILLERWWLTTSTIASRLRTGAGRS